MLLNLLLLWVKAMPSRKRVFNIESRPKGELDITISQRGAKKPDGPKRVLHTMTFTPQCYNDADLPMFLNSFFAELDRRRAYHIFREDR